MNLILGANIIIAPLRCAIIRPHYYNSLFLITTVGTPGCGLAVNTIIHYLYLKAKRQTRGTSSPDMNIPVFCLHVR